MSIAIVSALPKSVPASASENAGAADSASSSLDFAGLLGQLFPVATEAMPVATEAIEQLDTKHAGTDDFPEEALPNDAASLLALMGLVPPAPPSGITEAASSQVNAGIAATATIAVGTETTNGSPVDPLLSGKTANDAAPDSSFIASAGEQKSEDSLSSMTTPATNDRLAAKIAVSTVSGNDEELIPANKTPVEAGSNPLSAIASGMPVHPGGQPAAHKASLSVPTAVRDSQWNNDFSQKIVWLATNDKQTAELTLNPPQMGPIEISLNMNNDKASATFVSANAEVREAIETALPRLREMLAGAGIELGQTNVSAESFRQPGNGSNGTNGAALSRNDNGILSTDAPGAKSSGMMTALSGNGLVDIFA